MGKLPRRAEWMVTDDLPSLPRTMGVGVTVTCTTLLDGDVTGWFACGVEGSFPLGVAIIGEPLRK
jgi:hypothetical protein